jgi:hypothetical protein
VTPQTIEDAARRKYNSTGSTFYAQAEIWALIYQAELEIARETKMLEGRTTISGGSIASTQSYAYPTGVLEVKRVEYNGQKLKRIDFREDDRITFLNSNTTETGTPTYYYDWDRTLYFRPIPDTSALAIRIYYYKEPAEITSASQVLEIPSIFHMCIVDYVAAELAAKDTQWDTAKAYFDKWYEKHLPAMVKWTRKRRTGDSFGVTRDEMDLTGTNLGPL